MLNIDITNKCRIKCPQCQRQMDPSYLKGTREIKLEKLKLIFDVFPKINFSGQISDPIYHREFHQILEYLNPDNEYLICTNGHGFDREWWTKTFTLSLDKKDLRWRFGLDGLPKDSHKYRVGQDGEQVWEMMQLGASMGLNIEWQYIVFKYNENDIEEARSLADQHNINFILTKSSRFGLQEFEYLKPTNPEFYNAR